MKNVYKTFLYISVALMAVGLAPQAFAQQNTLIQTKLSSAINNTQTSFNLASVTGINAPTNTVPASELYIVDPGQIKGEAMNVLAVSGNTVTVQRGGPGKGKPHVSGSMVLVATNPNFFTQTDPSGSCTLALTYVTPLVNIQNGNQWLCSSVAGTWVPGFQNAADGPAQGVVTAAVASAASTITPSGPYFHITGSTLGITGFNIPVGFNGGQVCVIPDGTWTTVTGGNIAIASTAVVGRVNCWSYDSATAKFYPSY